MLTDRFIRSLSFPPAGYVEHTDEARRGAGALVLRVYASGRRVFFARVRVDGKLLRTAIGDYPDLSLAAARAGLGAAVASLRESVRAPVSPVSLGAPAITVSALSGQWLDSRVHAGCSAVTLRDYRQILNAYVLPVVGDMLISAVTVSDVVKIVESAQSRGRQSLASHIYIVLRAFLNYAVDLELIPHAPLPGRNARPVPPLPQSTRALSLDEVRDFLQLSPLHLVPSTRLILLLSLATGQRVGEVCQLQESELSGNVWALAGEEHRAHEIFLSDFSVSVINEARALAGGSKYLFPSSGRAGHVQKESLSHALRLRFFPRSGWVHAPFTAHDLRRTVRTHLAEHGCSSDVGERILNHAQPGGRRGVLAVYNRASYREQIRDALEWWGGVLSDFV